MHTAQQTLPAVIGKAEAREIAEALIREHQQRISSRHKILIMYNQGAEAGTSPARTSRNESKSDSFLSRQWAKFEHFYELL
jgi:hypothetical protein